MSSLIASACFEIEWISKVRKKYPQADPGLIEKVIYAFELLGLLAASEGDFIFKGGTSMLLLVEQPRRLSIDIDILGAVGNFDFRKMINHTVFHRYELSDRQPGVVSKSHYKFFYLSKVNQREDYTLLDVVESDNPYGKIISKDINCGFFWTDRPIKIQMPTTECLLGDKLTAFAPNTIGVPYMVNKSMAIIKQLIDLDDLFMASSNINDIVETYQKTFAIENQFRNNQFTLDEVMADTLETCFLLSQLDLKNSKENEKTEELRQGIRQVSSHLLNSRYSLPHAKISAAKMAYLISLIKYKPADGAALGIRHDPEKISELNLIYQAGRYSILNKLRGFLPEAYYYWYLALAILNEQSKIIEHEDRR